MWAIDRFPAMSFDPSNTARAENYRNGLLSALRPHTKAPYKADLLWEKLWALNRSGRARTEVDPRLLRRVLRVAREVVYLRDVAHDAGGLRQPAASAHAAAEVWGVFQQRHLRAAFQ